MKKMTDDLVARLREKARSKQTYGGVTLREAADALEAKGKRIDALESRLIHKYIRIAELEAALKRVLDDIEDYERVNNLSPSPGKQDCWESVRAASAALKGEK